MKLMVLACVFLAANAAKLQGYSSQAPAGGVPLSTLTSSGVSTSAGQSQFVASSGHSSGSPAAHFSASSGQTSTGFGHQSISGQQSHVSPIGGNQLVHQTGGDSSFGVHGSGSAGSSGFIANCQDGQVRHFDGSCVTPEVTRNVFVYAAPAQEVAVAPLPENIPLPKVEHNIVFIRTQDNGNGQDPIIVAPPQKKHIIYVLNKESEQGQQVIEVPAHPAQNPEVYYVNYGEGETPTLPHGIDFESALNSAIHAEGQVIGGGSSGFVDGSGVGALTFGAGSGTVSGASGSGVAVGGSGSNFVSGSGVSGGNFVSGPSGSGNYGATAGGSQNFVNGGGISGNTFQVSPPVVVTAAPQQLYSAP